MMQAPSASAYSQGEITGKMMMPSAPRAKESGGFFDKMKKMLSRDAAPPAIPSDESDAPVFEVQPVDGASQDSLAALFGGQLASGLWEKPGKESAELRQLKATAEVLRLLLAEGITTTHPVFGAQVRKAAEALVLLVARLGKQEPELIQQALAAAWILSTGQRTRAALTKAAQGYPALVAKLADEAALRAEAEKAVV
jgi:Ca-activated chloride channel family protein